MTKEDQAKLQIDFSKIGADEQKYFDLFDKHIPENVNGNVLIYDISNLGCIYKIIQKNPEAKYFIYGNESVNKGLACMTYEFNVKFLDKDPLYNINNNMKFDLIIMNPPYDGNLHLKIFEEAINHLSKDGVCTNLSPTPWLAKSNINRPMAKYRSKFNGKIKNIEIIDHNTANILFGTGNAIEELGIYAVKNNNSKSVDLMNYGFTSMVEKSLYDKIGKISADKCLTFSKCISQGKGSQGGSAIRDYEVNVYTWHGGKTCKEAVIRTDDKKRSFVLYFNSQQERDNFINSLDTTFMNWYYQQFIVPGDYKIRNYMFVMDDYSQPWTDERFYKFFNLTKDEIKIIEETMAKYK